MRLRAAVNTQFNGHRVSDWKKDPPRWISWPLKVTASRLPSLQRGPSEASGRHVTRREIREDLVPAAVKRPDP